MVINRSKHRGYGLMMRCRDSRSVRPFHRPLRIPDTEAVLNRYDIAGHRLNRCRSMHRYRRESRHPGTMHSGLREAGHGNALIRTIWIIHFRNRLDLTGTSLAGSGSPHAGRVHMVALLPVRLCRSGIPQGLSSAGCRFRHAGRREDACRWGIRPRESSFAADRSDRIKRKGATWISSGGSDTALLSR